jgi:hypothetical protein
MRKTLTAGLLILAPVLVGCTVPPFSDPFDRPGTWQPTGVNDANIRAMAANPAHVQRGVGTSTELAAEAVPPVDRLFRGQRPALPRESSTAGSGGGN